MDYPERPGRQRDSAERSRQLRIGFAVCLIAVLTGVSTAFLIERPTFSTGGRDTSALITPVARALQSSGELERTQTVLPQPTATTAHPLATPVEATAQASQAAASPSPLTSSTVQPTAAAVVPTDTPPSANVVLQRVAAAEVAVRTGKLEATIEYGGGNRSSAQVRFDLGDDQRPPRCHITSLYEGTSSAQIIERITIGDRAWQRQASSPWTESAAHAGVADQVSVFLPHAQSITSAQIRADLNRAILRWYDASRDVDLTLTVDPTTGAPRELHELTRSTGARLTVVYSAWNTAVEDITPPE